ncbi:Vacuolar cation/proton exchanger 2 [Glycine soja]
MKKGLMNSYGVAVIVLALILCLGSSSEQLNSRECENLGFIGLALCSDCNTLSDDYLNRLNQYRQRVWTCKITGKSGLTYEEALVSEKHAAEKVQQIPEELVAPALRIIHYNKYCLGIERIRVMTLARKKIVKFNATELIISIYALKSGMTRVVQLSLLGSILSNMLLVLGCAFLCGGIVNHEKEQVFNKAATSVNSGLLLMAVMGILFPAVLHYTHSEVHVGKSELSLSRFSSCIMLVAYVAYLFFQLKSQRNLYVSVNEVGSLISSFLSHSFVCGYVGASMAWEIPVAFISVILLPLVGNAAEHASAIMFAMKDKLDISLGVAIGSSTQISMFVASIIYLYCMDEIELLYRITVAMIPFCVVIGWITGHPMDLNFQLFETVVLFLTVIVVAFMLQEGTANYFKGLMLILCYLIVAANFYPAGWLFYRLMIGAHIYLAAGRLVKMLFLYDV